MLHKTINEDGEGTPVTTTDNAGNGLKSPQLPIKPNLFRRIKNLKEQKPLKNKND